MIKSPVFNSLVDISLYEQGYNWGSMGFDLKGLLPCYVNSNAFVMGYDTFVSQSHTLANTTKPLVLYKKTKVRYGQTRLSNR